MSGFEPGILDFVPPSHAGPAWAFFCAVLLLGVGPGSALVMMLLRARALAKAQADEQTRIVERSGGALLPGPRRVVQGVVDSDDPGGDAVRVEIVQRVENHKAKNSRWHTWDDRAPGLSSPCRTDALSGAGEGRGREGRQSRYGEAQFAG